MSGVGDSEHTTHNDRGRNICSPAMLHQLTMQTTRKRCLLSSNVIIAGSSDTDKLFATQEALAGLSAAPTPAAAVMSAAAGSGAAEVVTGGETVSDKHDIL